jgi:hypothetical protein
VELNEGTVGGVHRWELIGMDFCCRDSTDVLMRRRVDQGVWEVLANPEFLVFFLSPR